MYKYLLVAFGSSLLVMSSLVQAQVTVNTGTANALPKYSDSSTMALSAVSEVGGQVGIGTTTPQAMLDIHGGMGNGNGIGINLYNWFGVPQAASRTSVIFSGGQAPNGFSMIQGGGDPSCYSCGAGYLSIQTADGSATLNEHMRVTGNGWVGIGTPAPQNALSVIGSFNVDQDDDNVGSYPYPGITFGNGSGEGIASARSGGAAANQYGLDFYTGFQKRASILNGGGLFVLPSSNGWGQIWATGTSAVFWGSTVSGAGTDLKQTNIYFDGNGTYHFQLVNDAGTSGLDALTIGRSGVNPSYMNINAPLNVPSVNVGGGGITFPGGGVQTIPYTGPPSLSAILAGTGNLMPSADLASDVVRTDPSSPQTITGTISVTSSMGIGTSTPDAKLVVSDAASAVMNIERTTNSGQALMDFVPAGGLSNSNPDWGIGMTQNVSDFGIWRWNGSAVTYSLTATTAGNVGIATTTPGADLTVANLQSGVNPPNAGTSVFEVNGDIALSQTKSGQMFFSDGTVQSTAWNGTTFGDFAESVDVLGDRTTYEPGDLIVIDDSETGKFDRSDKAYSRMVAGVYSTMPGIVGRRIETDRPNREAEVPMAMVGIVPTKVTTENGPVERGDLLVSSSKPGYAMKGTDSSRMMGAVIGKALAPLKTGSGVIEVLISLQ